MQQIFIEFIKEEKSRGRTVFMSSHIFEEIEEVCDRVAMIKAGRIIDTAVLYDLRHSKTKDYSIIFKNKEDAVKFADSNTFPKEVIENICRVKLPISDIGVLMSILKEYKIKGITEHKISLQDYFMNPSLNITMR